MKKLCGLFVMLFALVGISFATSPHKTITLYPGWNVVSTPAILSGIVFSNGGEGISFSKLLNGEWISVAATAENIKPLDGFMVYNNNSENVSMTLQYKKNVAPTETFLQRNLNYGWDFLGIVTTSSPFSNIGDAATMSVDFTNNGTTNNSNKVNTNYLWNSTSSSINNPQLGEAYGIFINQENAVYGAINNGGAEILDCINDSGVDVIISASKTTVLCKRANTKIAEFIVKPSNNACDVDLNTISFTLTGSTAFADFDEYDVTLTIGGETEDVTVTTGATFINVSASVFKTLPADGEVVTVVIEPAVTGNVVLNTLNLNGKAQSITFTKRFENALVWVADQKDNMGSTTFTLGVDKAASSDEISKVCLYVAPSTDLTDRTKVHCATNVEDGNEDIEWTATVTSQQLIQYITYTVNDPTGAVTCNTTTHTDSKCVYIDRETYTDYFKVGDTYAKVFAID